MSLRAHRSKVQACLGLALFVTSHGPLYAQAPYMVKDIDAASGSYPSDFVALGDALLFYVTLDTGEQGLWRSDGTPQGTYLLKPFEDLPVQWTCRSQAVVNGRLFFVANNIRELWRSDGTAAGTVLVSDLEATFAGPACDLTASNGTLFFVADGLWKSDGTAAGTTQVTSVRPYEMVDVNGTLFFGAEDGLWKSDGTNTTMVARLGWTPLRQLTNVGGTLFLSVDDGTHGLELWRSDGTTAGTVMVKDINPTGPSYPEGLTDVDGTLFFRASDDLHGSEPWKSDGTSAGTVMLKDINPGLDGSGPNDFQALGGRAFFFASDDGMRYVLASSDGTEAGTMTITVIDPGLMGPPPGSLVAEADRLYFFAHDGSHGREAWSSDATSSGTAILADIAAGPAWSVLLSELTAAGNKVFFPADDQVHGIELWAVNVSPKPTSFYVVDACRLVDTRNAAGPSGGPPLAARQTRTFPITGLCGVPSTARAVAVTLTVVGASELGNIRIFPAGLATYPSASALNFPTGQARGSNGIFRLGESGALSVWSDMVSGGGTAHLILDVRGYFE